MTITRERIAKIAAGGGYNFDEIEDLARIALASLEAGPVAWISERNLKNLGKSFSVYVKHEPVMVRPIPLFTAPPAPVVSLELGDLLTMAASAIEDLLEHTDPNTSYYSGVWADVPGKLRAAMLQADGTLTNEGTIPVGNSPVIQGGWVACSERMPEAGQYVLCLDNGDKYQNCIPDHDDIYTAAYCDRLGSFTTEYWGDHDWMSKRNPTHWSPLPDMPAAPQQESE